MTWLFLALLGLAWVAITVPAALRARRRSPLPSAEGFRRNQASMTARAAPGRWVLVPQSTGGRAEAARRRSQRHRRRLFVVFLSATVLSAGVAAWRGGGFWEVHFVVDACLGIYVAVLIDAKRRRREIETKAAQLESRRPDCADEELEPAVGHFGGRRA